MITRFKSQFRFLLILGALLLFLPFSARAQNASQYVTLGTVADTSGPVLLAWGTLPAPYVVPAGMVLLVTDFVFYPQTAPPPPGTTYILGIASQQPFLSNTSMTLTASADDLSTFQVHMTTGMLFQPGDGVKVWLQQGTPLNFYAYGHLLPQ
jgi:hypothetical protein